MSTQSKDSLLFDGEIQIANWCELNGVTPPKVEIHWDGRCDFGVCAYYRDGVIDIWPNMCAAIGTAGRSWSYPGYVVDRTPFGVLAHELGHHVDRAHGPRGGERSHVWRPLDPSPLTGYCPNDNEWFAELFRLFVTNPDLLRLVRPRIYPAFAGAFKSVEARPWREVLAGAERQIKAAENKIAKVARAAGPTER
jgi:hypothetical protein